jgi:Tfp pilus assembly protein PilE
MTPLQTHIANKKYGNRNSPGSTSAGFSMLEMTIAMMILFVGLLATASSISYAMLVSSRSRGVTNAKFMVTSILEQMETLRNTRQLTFAQIANTGNVDNSNATYAFGGFATGAQPVSKDPGPDCIFGTADDLTSPGADGLYGTSDDVTNDQTEVVAGYSRTISITSLDDNLKKIMVTLTYSGPGGDEQTLTATSYLNNDAGSNYLP